MTETMRAVQVGEQGGDFELVEREVPTPGPRRGPRQGRGLRRLPQRHVRQGGRSSPASPSRSSPGTRSPARSPRSARASQDWDAGQRVGVGWFGGNCGYCEPCRRGDLIACQNMGIPGRHLSTAATPTTSSCPPSALAAIPDDLAAEDAAPLLCAGITTFNALRHSGARAGDLVAVLGVGGLGHLGVQFAAKMGFHTVAIARGTDKEALARELGARRLHRQHAPGRRPRSCSAGRRDGRPGDRHQRRRDGSDARRPRRRRPADRGRRLAGADRRCRRPR